MQQLLSQTNQIRGGGRVATSHYRQSLQQREDFTGLEEDCNRYSLLLLCKRVGRLADFTPRMIQLLEYYMAFTRDYDWEDACQVLGRYGASLCILVTDRAMQRPNNPVRIPAAYFCGMVRQGRAGQLRLHSSIFALITRSSVNGGCDA